MSFTVEYRSAEYIQIELRVRGTVHPRGVSRLLGYYPKSGGTLMPTERVEPSTARLSNSRRSGAYYYDLTPGIYIVDAVLGSNGERGQSWLRVTADGDDELIGKDEIRQAYPAEAEYVDYHTERLKRLCEEIKKEQAEFSTVESEEGWTAYPEFSEHGRHDMPTSFSEIEHREDEDVIMRYATPLHYIVAQPFFGKGETPDAAFEAARRKKREQEERERQRRQEAEQARQQAGAQQLKNLTGTERQVNFAEKIRAAYIQKHGIDANVKRLTKASTWIERYKHLVTGTGSRR